MGRGCHRTRQFPGKSSFPGCPLPCKLIALKATENRSIPLDCRLEPHYLHSSAARLSWNKPYSTIYFKQHEPQPLLFFQKVWPSSRWQCFETVNKLTWMAPGLWENSQFLSAMSPGIGSAGLLIAAHIHPREEHGPVWGGTPPHIAKYKSRHASSYIWLLTMIC